MRQFSYSAGPSKKQPLHPLGRIIFIVISLILPLTGGFLYFLNPPPTPPATAASTVYDIHGKPAATFYIRHRQPVPLKKIPLFLRQAFLAVEDHRFYQHFGVNPGRIAKAAWYNLRYRKIQQGGSTITQQLAKNLYLSHERSLSRKLKELYYTLQLERHLTKDEILEQYLNQIYFGHGAYGVKVAAETFFHKDLTELNEAEMALLAGLPRGPAFYSPYEHPKAARLRIEQVLRRMETCQMISPQEYRYFSRQRLSLPGLESSLEAPYFMDLLQKELSRIFPDNPQILYTAGLSVESTLDIKAQTAANQVFDKGLPLITHDKHGIPQPQGSLIAIDPRNGEIRALIGGSDFQTSQFNRAIQAHRQPGSAFKPIVYATALKQGFTLASLFDRTPKTYDVSGSLYRPTDGGKETSGNLSLRNALASSNNVVTVKVMEQLGPAAVISLASKLGIHSKLAPTLPLALGSSAVTPLELASAYLPFANGGIRFEPTVIRRIRDRHGRILYEKKVQKGTPVLDSRIAFLITDALTGVFKPGGTAAKVGPLLNRPAAGKTGTTKKNRDAWFVGYTPNLLAVVFIGCDNYEKELPGSADRVAAPLWVKFMMKALNKVSVYPFKAPPGLKKVSICQSSGELPTEWCTVQSEYFMPDTVPTSTCQVHTGEVDVCDRSGLLPNKFCQNLHSVPVEDAPVYRCTVCREGMNLTEEEPEEELGEETLVKEEKEKGWRRFFKRLFGG